MTRQPRKITLADVAREANVSSATISRLMRGSATVNPETRERVIKASARLGFEFEGKRKSKIIAFLLSNREVLHPFHSAILMGAEAYCAEHEYGLLFLPLKYSLTAAANDLELPEVLLRTGIVAGVIVAGTNSQGILDALSLRRIPFVVLGNNVIGDWMRDRGGSVFFDDIGGAAELTQYLISFGHREIGFVGNLSLPWFMRRYTGYKQAMESSGMTPLSSNLNSGEGEEMGYLMTKIMLQRKPRVTAIFAGDDMAAHGVYKAAWDIGLQIPEDLSVVGFNDTPEAIALHPPLTTMHVFADKAGQQLAEMLLQEISLPGRLARSVPLPTRMIRRESCGPAAPESPDGQISPATGLSRILRSTSLS